ncbi:MAG: hypothetical protein ACK6BC_09220 [Cyanobacteriota bacterium]|jgi:hypothetical protein
MDVNTPDSGLQQKQICCRLKTTYLPENQKQIDRIPRLNPRVNGSSLDTLTKSAAMLEGVEF